MTTVSIHQPTFLPWVGYFQKIVQSDVHVILDDVQASRTSSWINRVKVLCNGIPRWLTVPIDRTEGSLVQVSQLRARSAWSAEVLNRLADYYRTARHLKDVMEVLESLLQNASQELATSNVRINLELLHGMNVRLPEVLSASTLGVTSSASTRLVEIVEAVGGSRYLSGTGAGGYMELETFADRGIDVDYVTIADDPYGQLNTTEFYPGLSVIDGLFNLGFDAVGGRVRNAEVPK